MNLNEALKLLQLRREQVVAAIDMGIELPVSKDMAFLVAVPIGTDYDIDEASLDSFISRFHNEQPGRHPPVAVRRQLLVESKHRCGVCGEPAPMQFHHIVDFAKIGHYDPQHMLALCPTCHAYCTNGFIDSKSQYMYKNQLASHQSNGNGMTFADSVGSANFSWSDLRQVISLLHTSVISSPIPKGESRYDFSAIDLQHKNELNNLGAEYFEQVIVEHHEPYFHRIDSFLKKPVNQEIAELYHQVVDELRSKIAANRSQFDRFEYFFIAFGDAAVNKPVGITLNRRALNVLLSYMYVTCSIGRKQ